jgi:hypothetical protein
MARSFVSHAGVDVVVVDDRTPKPVELGGGTEVGLEHPVHRRLGIGSRRGRGS